MNIDLRGHRTQRCRMTFFAPRLSAPARLDRRFDGRGFIIRRRRGSEFHVLLFEATVLSLELFELVFQGVDAFVGKVPLFAIVVAVAAKKGDFAPQELQFLLPLLVEFQLAAVHGTGKLNHFSNFARPLKSSGTVNSYYLRDATLYSFWTKDGGAIAGVQEVR